MPRRTLPRLVAWLHDFASTSADDDTPTDSVIGPSLPLAFAANNSPTATVTMTTSSSSRRPSMGERRTSDYAAGVGPAIASGSGTSLASGAIVNGGAGSSGGGGSKRGSVTRWRTLFADKSIDNDPDDGMWDNVSIQSDVGGPPERIKQEYAYGTVTDILLMHGVIDLQNDDAFLEEIARERQSEEVSRSLDGHSFRDSEHGRRGSTASLSELSLPSHQQQQQQHMMGDPAPMSTEEITDKPFRIGGSLGRNAYPPRAGQQHFAHHFPGGLHSSRPPSAQSNRGAPVNTSMGQGTPGKRRSSSNVTNRESISSLVGSIVNGASGGYDGSPAAGGKGGSQRGDLPGAGSSFMGRASFDSDTGSIRSTMSTSSKPMQKTPPSGPLPPIPPGAKPQMPPPAPSKEKERDRDKERGPSDSFLQISSDAPRSVGIPAALFTTAGPVATPPLTASSRDTSGAWRGSQSGSSVIGTPPTLAPAMRFSELNRGLEFKAHELFETLDLDDDGYRDMNRDRSNSGASTSSSIRTRTVLENARSGAGSVPVDVGGGSVVTNATKRGFRPGQSLLEPDSSESSPSGSFDLGFTPVGTENLTLSLPRSASSSAEEVTSPFTASNQSMTSPFAQPMPMPIQIQTQTQVPTSTPLRPIDHLPLHPHSSPLHPPSQQLLAHSIPASPATNTVPASYSTSSNFASSSSVEPLQMARVLSDFGPLPPTMISAFEQRPNLSVQTQNTRNSTHSAAPNSAVTQASSSNGSIRNKAPTSERKADSEKVVDQLLMSGLLGSTGTTVSSSQKTRTKSQMISPQSVQYQKSAAGKTEPLALTSKQGRLEATMPLKTGKVDAGLLSGLKRRFAGGAQTKSGFKNASAGERKVHDDIHVVGKFQRASGMDAMSLAGLYMSAKADGKNRSKGKGVASAGAVNGDEYGVGQSSSSSSGTSHILAPAFEDGVMVRARTMTSPEPLTTGRSSHMGASPSPSVDPAIDPRWALGPMLYSDFDTESSAPPQMHSMSFDAEIHRSDPRRPSLPNLTVDYSNASADRAKSHSSDNLRNANDDRSKQHPPSTRRNNNYMHATSPLATRDMARKGSMSSIGSTGEIDTRLTNGGVSNHVPLDHDNADRTLHPFDHHGRIESEPGTRVPLSPAFSVRSALTPRTPASPFSARHSGNTAIVDAYLDHGPRSSGGRSFDTNDSYGPVPAAAPASNGSAKQPQELQLPPSSSESSEILSPNAKAPPRPPKSANRERRGQRGSIQSLQMTTDDGSASDQSHSVYSQGGMSAAASSAIPSPVDSTFPTRANTRASNRLSSSSQPHRFSHSLNNSPLPSAGLGIDQVAMHPPRSPAGLTPSTTDSTSYLSSGPRPLSDFSAASQPSTIATPESRDVFGPRMRSGSTPGSVDFNEVMSKAAELSNMESRQRRQSSSSETGVSGYMPSRRKRPAFGLNVAPSAAAAFDSIPSPDLAAGFGARSPRSPSMVFSPARSQSVERPVESFSLERLERPDPEDQPQSPGFDDVEFIDDGGEEEDRPSDAMQTFPVDLDDEEDHQEQLEPRLPLSQSQQHTPQQQQHRTRHHSQPPLLGADARNKTPVKQINGMIRPPSSSSMRLSGASIDMQRPSSAASGRLTHRTSAASLSDLQKSRSYTFL